MPRVRNEAGTIRSGRSWPCEARGLAPMVALQGLPAEGYFAAAETAGLTHAALRAAYPVAATGTKKAAG